MAPKTVVNIPQEVATLKDQGFALGDKVVYKAGTDGARHGVITNVIENEGKCPMIEYTYKNAKVSGWGVVVGGGGVVFSVVFFVQPVVLTRSPSPIHPKLEDKVGKNRPTLLQYEE